MYLQDTLIVFARYVACSVLCICKIRWKGERDKSDDVTLPHSLSQKQFINRQIINLSEANKILISESEAIYL